VVFVGVSRRRKAMLAAVLAALVLLLPGCGGSPDPGRLLSDMPASAGTYKIKVSAVTPSIERFTTVELVID
jgi:hypothetical protein